VGEKRKKRKAQNKAPETLVKQMGGKSDAWRHVVRKEERSRPRCKKGKMNFTFKKQAAE